MITPTDRARRTLLMLAHCRPGDALALIAGEISLAQQDARTEALARWLADNLPAAVVRRAAEIVAGREY